MCGFAGIVGTVTGRAATVARMTTAIAHRGPDDHGYFEDPDCALGHRRLSIIDLSPNGRQPMGNEDDTVQVAFNGEIYNFQDLRRDLETRGHRFRSRTDSEVLVHLYEERGEQMVTALRGMFAFALWDARKRRLLLARDHFGQKPLFYARVGGALLFASEIKGLLASGLIDREPDPTAIDLMLRTQMVPSPRTCFAAIRRLPPATTLTATPGESPRLDRYWTLAGTPVRRISLDEAAEEVTTLARAAVTEQMVADVPVGIFVSGGIDSTLVLEMVCDSGVRPQTFTLGYHEAAYSEVDAAQRSTLGHATDHHIVMMSASDLLDPGRLVDLFDEPFVDVAALPLAHLARHARAHVKVALTGDGGDELFGGYAHHVLGYWLDRVSRVDAIRTAGVGAAVRAIARSDGPGFDRVRRFLMPFAQPSWQRAVATLRTVVTDELADELYTSAFRAASGSPRASDYFFADPHVAGEPAPLESLFCPSGDLFLADRLLMKSDLATMAAGLESRSPLLDLRLAELAASLPPELKIEGRRGKRVLRHVLAQRTPAEVWRRPKSGFTMPLDEWLKRELRDTVGDTLLAPGSRVGAYLRPEVLSRLYREHCDGKRNWRRILWSALLLELWLRRTDRS